MVVHLVKVMLSYNAVGAPPTLISFTLILLPIFIFLAITEGQHLQ